MSSEKSTAQELTSFELLCKHIAVAMRTRGSIKVAASTIEKLKIGLKTIRRSQAHVPDADIAELVSLLDGQGDLCSRLEPMTFSAILETVLQAGYSQLKERGIFLLAVSLHDSNHKRTSSRIIEARKSSIGKGCLQILISCFSNADEHPRLRRWVGVMIMQLLGREEVIAAFEAGPEENKRKLGTMVISEKNEMLKIICGQILRTLITSEIPPKDLWPVGTDSQIYSTFPASSQKERHWSNAFQAYMDGLSNSLGLSQGDNGRLYFGQALETSPFVFRNSGSIITILIDSDMTICTQAGEGFFDEYLDIPIALVAELWMENTLLESATNEVASLEQSLETCPIDLVIRLHRNDSIPCYVNSTVADIRELRITVQNRDTANTIGSDIQTERRRHKTIGGKVSQTKDTITIGNSQDEPFHREDPSPTIDYVLIPGSANQEFDLPDIFPEPTAVPVTIDDELAQAKKNSLGNEEAKNFSPEQITYNLEALEIESFVTKTILEEQAAPGLQHLERPTGTDMDQEPQLPCQKSKSGQEAIIALSEEIDSPRNVEAPNDEHVVNSNHPKSTTGPPGAGIHTPAPVSRPKTFKSLGILAGLELNEEPFDLPLSPTKSSRQKTRPTRSRDKKTIVEADKPEVLVAKQNIRRAKKPGLIPKSSLIVVKNESSKKPLLSLTKVAQKKKVTRPVLNQNSEVEALTKQKQPQTKRSVPKERPIAGRTHGLEDRPSKIVGRMRKGMPSSDLYNLNVPLSVNKAIKSFPSKLTAMLKGLDDIEHPDLSTKLSLADPKPTENRSNTILFESKMIATSVEQESPLPVKTKMPSPDHYVEKVRTSKAQVPTRSSPRLMSRTKDAAAALNDILVDSHMARKTPLVGFSAKGPRNQGRLGAKKSPLLPLNKAERSLIYSALSTEDGPYREGKRKRSLEEPAEDERVKRQHNLKSQKSTFSVPHSERVLPPAFLDVEDQFHPIVSSNDRPVRVFEPSGSRVDENGSPRASSTGIRQHENYKAIVKKTLKQVPRTMADDIDEANTAFSLLGDETLPAMLQPSLLTFPKSPSQLLSNENHWSSSTKRIDKITKLYVSPEKVVGDELIKFDKHIPVKRHKIADPFHEKKPERKSSKFTQRLQFRQKKAAAERITQPLRPSLFKRKIAIIEDPEATLVNIENEAPIEEVSSGNELMVDSSDRFTDVEARTSPFSADRTASDEWRTALKPHQKGMLEALYQISNASFALLDLVRYLIGHEEALDDLVDDYLRGGSQLVKEFETKHQEERRHVGHENETIKKALGRSFADSRQHMLQNIKDVKKLPVDDVEKIWNEEQDLLQKMVEDCRAQYK